MLASPFWAKFVNIKNPAPRGAEGCRGSPGGGMGESRGGGGSKWVSNVSPPLHLCMGVSLNPVHSIWVFSL